jgi:hypothetical protein
MTSLIGPSTNLTLATGTVPQARTSPNVKSLGRASPPAQVWARRKRRQWILGATIGVALLGAQAYGWLFLFHVV